MLLSYSTNLVEPQATPGRIYLGYSSAWLQNMKAREEEREAGQRALEPEPPEPPEPERAANVVLGRFSEDLNKADRRAVRRSVNAAIKAAQHQALLALHVQLIESQRAQGLAMQRIMDVEDDALVSLLLTI